jgi:hypothetical protein
MRFADAAALRGAYDEQLSKGRAFVADATAACDREACELVLEHAGRTFTLRAEVVFRKEDAPGVGLQLAALDAAAKGALSAFVDEAGGAADTSSAVAEEPPGDDEGAHDADDERAAKTVFDRIRALTTVEQQRVAAHGTMQERIILERTFGANVWESLLGNPRLTVPEVARIARKGTLPRKLVEDIAAHASWVAAPEVQRALLANPRSTAPVVAKVLRALPRSELQLVPQQTTYPAAVRAAAKKMLGGG